LHHSVKLRSNSCRPTIRFQKFRGTEFCVLEASVALSGLDWLFAIFQNSDPKLLSRKFFSACFITEPAFAHTGIPVQEWGVV